MHAPSATTLRSQPSAGSRLQLSKFCLQAPSVQAELSHLAWAFASGGHSKLQMPQLLTSVARSTQSWPQQLKPGWHGWAPEQPGMHVSFTQIDPALQSVSSTQPTQAFMLVSHFWLLVQSVLSVQPT